jgi:hypothetical protein
MTEPRLWRTRCRLLGGDGPEDQGAELPAQPLVYRPLGNHPRRPPGLERKIGEVAGAGEDVADAWTIPLKASRASASAYVAASSGACSKKIVEEEEVEIDLKAGCPAL